MSLDFDIRFVGTHYSGVYDENLLQKVGYNFESTEFNGAVDLVQFDRLGKFWRCYRSNFIND